MQLTECRTRKFSPNLDRPLVWAGGMEMGLPMLRTHVFPIFAVVTQDATRKANDGNLAQDFIAGYKEGYAVRIFSKLNNSFFWMQ